MAVIGAGPVGLAVAKALLQHGIPYEHLEADDDLGGNWYHGVYASAHIISSKKTTEYADFPMPAHYPDFPSAQQMLDYLRAYAEAFTRAAFGPPSRKLAESARAPIPPIAIRRSPRSSASPPRAQSARGIASSAACYVANPASSSAAMPCRWT